MAKSKQQVKKTEARAERNGRKKERDQLLGSLGEKIETLSKQTTAMGSRLEILSSIHQGTARLGERIPHLEKGIQDQADRVPGRFLTVSLFMLVVLLLVLAIRNTLRLEEELDRVKLTLKEMTVSAGQDKVRDDGILFRLGVLDRLNAGVQQSHGAMEQSSQVLRGLTRRIEGLESKMTPVLAKVSDLHDVCSGLESKTLEEEARDLQRKESSRVSFESLIARLDQIQNAPSYAQDFELVQKEVEGLGTTLDDMILDVLQIKRLFAQMLEEQSVSPTPSSEEEGGDQRTEVNRADVDEVPGVLEGGGHPAVIGEEVYRDVTQSR